jgi:hypothetical protein
MSKDKIDPLIQELKALQVREQNIINELEETHRAQLQGQEDPPSHSGASPPVYLSVSDIVAIARTTDHIPVFKIGDQVVIINKVRRTSSRALNEGDRTGTVVAVSHNRIDIRTSNGTLTWRAPKNLRLVPHHGG